MQRRDHDDARLLLDADGDGRAGEAAAGRERERFLRESEVFFAGVCGGGDVRTRAPRGKVLSLSLSLKEREREREYRQRERKGDEEKERKKEREKNRREKTKRRAKSSRRSSPRSSLGLSRPLGLSLSCFNSRKIKNNAFLPRAVKEHPRDSGIEGDADGELDQPRRAEEGPGGRHSWRGTDDGLLSFFLRERERKIDE